MEKVGLFHFVAEPYLMDFRGRVTLPMIGNYLIHAASSHAGERGFGFNDMSERHTAWVLSRLAIEMTSYPAMSESVTLYTWVDEVGKLFVRDAVGTQHLFHHVVVVKSDTHFSFSN